MTPNNLPTALPVAPSKTTTISFSAKIPLVCLNIANFSPISGKTYSNMALIVYLVIFSWRVSILS